MRIFSRLWFWSILKFSNFFVTVINDCCDSNARGRINALIHSLFGQSPNFIRVDSEFEAAINLIDALNVIRDMRGAILVNVAPRNGAAKEKWENGSPFCYFYYNKVLVVSSFDGYTLSLVRKLKVVEHVMLMDTREALLAVEKQGGINRWGVEYIASSQFRSLNFLPRIAHWILSGYKIPAQKVPVSEIQDIGALVCCVDNFGNAKTALLPQELEVNCGKVSTTVGQLEFYESLSDVPDLKPALVRGSSGLSNHQFVEVVYQGMNAAEQFSLHVGDCILPSKQGR